MSIGLLPEPQKPILPNVNYVTFNQDYSRFAFGTRRSFLIYTTEPYKEVVHYELKNANMGIGIIELYNDSTTVALVGAGGDPGFPSNKVILFDYAESKATGEVPFVSDIRGVRLQHDTLAIAIESHVYVYALSSLELLWSSETEGNWRGLLAVGLTKERSLLAYPSLPGADAAMQGKHTTASRGILCLHDMVRATDTFIQAHESAISVVAFNADCSYMATASDKGTLIRVFDVTSGSLVREFRRGADRAVVYCLAFSPDSHFLVASSDKGTIHVFAIRTTTVENRKSRLSFLSGICSYASSEWSCAWHRGPEVPSVCGFSPSGHAIFIARSTGEFCVLAFDPNKRGELLGATPHGPHPSDCNPPK